VSAASPLGKTLALTELDGVAQDFPPSIPGPQSNNEYTKPWSPQSRDLTALNFFL